MAIVVHMRPSVTRRRPYGANQARIFLNEVLPAAPDVAMQIAHLAGAGGYDDLLVDQALAVFTDAVANQDRRMAHVYFEASGVAGLGKWGDKASLIARRSRHLGARRSLGCISAATSIRRRISYDREQHRPLYALIRAGATTPLPPDPAH